MAAVVVLTAQTAAMARGQAPAQDRIVLCIGLGTATVYIDEDGNPTAPPHICPDAMLAFAEALLPQPQPPLHTARWNVVAHTGDAVLLADRKVKQARARGPPII